MLNKLIITILATTFLNSFAIAETFEIKMLNKGAGGKMIYEPNYLAITSVIQFCFYLLQKDIMLKQ